MKVIYNNKMVSETELFFPENHRGLSYGDGLFETIIYKEGVIKYLDRHLNRLHRGMRALGMSAEGELLYDKISNNCMELIQINGMASSQVRIKIIVWRKKGGLFTPLDNNIDHLITAKEQLKEPHPPSEAEISEQIFLYPSPYSKFKTCNMLPYIIAGIEKKKRNLSELVLLSHEGHIAECSSSNIFWVKDGVYFTPSLETGCIEGIIRGVVMEKLVEQGKEIYEVKVFPEVLQKADAAFTTNVSGIRPIQRFEKRIYNSGILAPLLSSLD